ncbi:MAG: hypothetical protein AAB658_21730 [Chloroflexota bacterium]
MRTTATLSDHDITGSNGGSDCRTEEWRVVVALEKGDALENLRDLDDVAINAVAEASRMEIGHSQLSDWELVGDFPGKQDGDRGAVCFTLNAVSAKPITRRPFRYC